jgi:class 3 adenylate cyclase
MMFVFCALIVVLLQRRFVLRFVQLRQERAGREHVYRLLGEYVSPEVREKVVNEKAALRGERKLVAVLFSDIRGFTSFSEKSDPAVIVARLNEYFDAMVQCITRNGGVVDKFVGDAIMAVFGGVLPLDDPCSAAVRAAQEMRAELRTLEAAWRAQGVAPFDNGIGVHYGEVVQGNIGSHDRKDFTVIGDAVNTASRLEGLTKAYAAPIVISADVWARLSPELRAACHALGRAKVKGKEEELELFGVAPGRGDAAPGAPQA